jgi:sortase A
MGRRLVSAFLVLAGIALLSAAALHYFRGYEAQRTGLQEWEASRSRTPVPTLHVPPPTAKENPGILGTVPSPAAAETNAPPYPRGEPIARLRIAAAQIDAVVFAGDDAATLEKGPGHVPGTEMPGDDTYRKNCVITGHRDSHFRHLGWLRVGHRIELEAHSGEIAYRVVSREIVNPDDVRVLQATANPRLTLITCYPFNYIGPAPKRLVIVAEPIRHPS